MNQNQVHASANERRKPTRNTNPLNDQGYTKNIMLLDYTFTTLA